MLCYLESVRIIERENRTPMLSCTWVGKSGDSDAAKTEKRGKRRILNRKAALARTTTLTKGIFPSDMDDLFNWLCDLTPLHYYDTERNELSEHEEVLNYVRNLGLDVNDDEAKECCLIADGMQDENLTYVGLDYVQVPVSELDDKHEFCYYQNVAGNEVKLLTITAIGYTELDDDGNEIIENGKPVWELDGQESATDMAVDSGTYYFESLEEEEEDEITEEPEEKPKKPEEKTSTSRRHRR